MTIPANTQQAAEPWGAEAVYACYGTEGGPYTGVSEQTPLPVVGVTGGPGSVNVFVDVVNNLTTLVELINNITVLPGEPSPVVVNIQGSPFAIPVTVKIAGPGLDPREPLVVFTAPPREKKGHQKTTITSSTSETTIVSAEVGVRLDIFSLIIANTSAVAATVTIKDSTTGTTRWVIAVPAGETRGFHGPLESAHKQTDKNNNWTATCTSVASIEITVLYSRN